jgi:hypothetical protein
MGRGNNVMNCPSCGAKMIKQESVPMDGKLEVRNLFKNHDLWTADWFDHLAEWWKCSMANCPMSVYLSHQAKE